LKTSGSSSAMAAVATPTITKSEPRIRKELPRHAKVPLLEHVRFIACIR